MEESGWPQLVTGLLGGVDTVTRADLRAMQTAPYILRARAGELTRVPVEKSLVPRDPKGHNQGISLSMASDGALYVSQATIMSKSEDGGRTWSGHSVDEGGPAQLLADGTFVRLSRAPGPAPSRTEEVRTSTDEGRTWKRLSEIEIDLPVEYGTLSRPRAVARLPDDSLLWAVTASDLRSGGGGASGDERYLMGGSHLFFYRSVDGGRTWDGPWPAEASGSEGGTTLLPSGRLLATIRYQRPLLPTDPPGTLERSGGSEAWAYKHVRLIESADQGRTWDRSRQLTTVFGQCHGFPTALSDGTVVVIHDSRYGPGGARIPDIPLDQKVPSPGVPSGRAMISHDEGRTWEDEVYYTHYGDPVSGYSQSVVLDDDTVLTIAGTCDYLPSATSWDAAVGRSDLTAIRWRPVNA